MSAYSFSEALERQVRDEIKPILESLVAYYDASYRVTPDMLPLLTLDDALDKLTKLATSMY